MLKVKVTTTAQGYESWSLRLEVSSDRKVRDLKALLAVEPHSLPVADDTKVLARIGGSGGGAMVTLKGSDKVRKDIVLLNVIPRDAAPPAPAAYTPPAAEAQPRRPVLPTTPTIVGAAAGQQPSQPEARSPAAASGRKMKLTVRTNANGFKNWVLELEVSTGTSVADVKRILSRPPHFLEIKPTQVVSRPVDKPPPGRGFDLLRLKDTEPVPPEIVLADFLPVREDGEELRAEAQSPSRVSSKTGTELPRMLQPEERAALGVRIYEFQKEHGRLPPGERRLRSWPRTLAGTRAMWMSQGYARIGTTSRPYVFWVFGCSDEVELEIAKAGYFADANMFDGTPCEVILWGEKISPFGPGVTDQSPFPENGPARVSSATYDEFNTLEPGSVRRPDQNTIFIAEAGQLAGRQLLPTRADAGSEGGIGALWSYFNPHNSGFLMLTFRTKPPADKAKVLQTSLAGKVFHPLMKNIFSAAAGDPSAEYDDNGWQVGLSGTDAVLKFVEMMQKIDHTEADNVHDDVKIPCVFWGIVDLKYDASKPLNDRVMVLETGDGWTSRFSHAGAPIPKRFRARYKAGDGSGAGKHAVVSANKKLTHDLIKLYGYDHLLPRQVCYPRVYTDDLAERILEGLGIENQEELVVLKLCNRSRAAGVIPVPAEELDLVLLEVLNPPRDIERWMQKKLDTGNDATIDLDWGCFEEHVRHWWSNECPHFVAERYCTSHVVEENGESWDGTMRVAFALRRRPHERIVPGRSGEQVAAPNPLLEHSPPAEELEIDWMGGYWKLPKEGVTSTNVRHRTISAARTSGTALVPTEHLFEVYAALGDILQQLFGGSEPSPAMLAKQYDGEPELGSYLTARLAIAMRDLSRARSALKTSNSLIKTAQEGWVRSCAESFVARGQGIIEAMTPPGRWESAEKLFLESQRCLPWNATTLYLLGMCALEAERPDEAVQLFERSLLLDLDFRAPYVCLGIAYLRVRRFADAIELSEAGLRRHPESPQCNYHIGVACYYQAQELEQQPGGAGARGQPAKEVQRLRQRALEEILAARESEEGQRAQFRGNRGRGPARVEGPWTDEDDEMVALLQGNRAPRSKLLTSDFSPPVGWRFLGWRN